MFDYFEIVVIVVVVVGVAVVELLQLAFVLPFEEPSFVALPFAVVAVDFEIDFEIKDFEKVAAS